MWGKQLCTSTTQKWPKAAICWERVDITNSCVDSSWLMRPDIPNPVKEKKMDEDKVVCVWKRENVCRGNIPFSLTFSVCVCCVCVCVRLAWWLLSTEAEQRWVTVIEGFQGGGDADECGQQTSEDDNSVTEEWRKRRTRNPEKQRRRTGDEEKSNRRQINFSFFLQLYHQN